MNRTLGIVILLLLTPAFLFCQEEESEIESLILAHDSDSSFDITFLKRINMGIPGGDNWLVEWTSNHTGEVRRSNVLFAYIINDGNIIREINLGPNFYINEYTDFDIMKDIPGIRVGGGSCVVYDYNGDGFDDIFNYGFWGSGFYIRITGYDLEKRNITFYADIPFEIVNRERGPAPVEFVTYKGMKGFKVYFFLLELAGGPGWISNPDARNGKWIFYAWNEGQRKFVEIEEFVETEKDNIKPSQPILVEQNTGEFAQDRGVLEETAPSDSGKNSRFIFYIAIAVGVIALAVAVVFTVRRKKG